MNDIAGIYYSKSEKGNRHFVNFRLDSTYQQVLLSENSVDTIICISGKWEMSKFSKHKGVINLENWRRFQTQFPQQQKGHSSVAQVINNELIISSDDDSQNFKKKN